MTEETPRQSTIFDVARLAGVSHQTVSRVLNNLPNVRPSTRQRVEDAIKKLRYVPSPAARALVTRRSRTIGLIATGGPEFGPSTTLLYFNAAARHASWSVFTANMIDSEPNSIRTAIGAFLRQNVEGIAVITAHQGTVDIVAGMELTIPLVALEATSRPGITTVGADQYAGARRAVAHLAELGHRDIAHLAGPSDSVDSRERSRGWRDELSERGLSGQIIGDGDWTPSSGYRFGAECDLDRLTAVFVSNDQMSVGLIHALTERGRTVPGDVSIVGFDDIPESAYLAPPLTTMRQDFQQIGEGMLAALLARINGESPTIAPSIPQLIERASTRRIG
ncbi:LacI family DNA-binding transcriptional regulator [Agromyces atrinae]|uniref:DNA-binding LacI/PurR family transcriptional regulator n=1 Tax=Agromyces atrinae TaxID=592376 RepID=A0A852S145_9MICO|nr:LacI family DNA-binding transcriptional regulator [Agromyces atrinae]NYD65606.1 DNA-binding LacI/PurR family transcriptional regulator [Agromyces atrinae]